jgi:hypothetical protein
LIASLAAALMGAASPEIAHPAAAIDPRAERVVERTRTTNATYARYAWNWVRDADGSSRQEWSAEFHRGTLHRVETPRLRVVADCAERTGSALDIETRESVEGPQVAAVACGIAARAAVESLEWLGARDSRFGPVDLVRLVDASDERIYAVDSHGALVAFEISPRDAASRVCLQGEAVATAPTLPEDDIFSTASLARSVVPEVYRVAPMAPVGDLWTRDPSCGAS